MAASISSVGDAVQEIDDNSWVISSRFLIKRQATPHVSQTSWSDSQGLLFALSEATEQTLPSRPLHPTNSIPKVYSTANRAATWQFGDAFLKIKDMTEQEAQETREHVTLEQLHARGGWKFTLPQVLFHALLGKRYIILTTAVAGQTLGRAWPLIDEETRAHYVGCVIEACKDMAEWTADHIGGVDKRTLADSYLAGRNDGYDNEHLLVASNGMGMDCSVPLRFFHCDLGPGNVIVNGRSHPIGIIDWECAGFVPREWIRTKFRLSSGLDLPWDEDSRLEYRRSVGIRMGEQGFLDVVDGFWRLKAKQRDT